MPTDADSRRWGVLDTHSLTALLCAFQRGVWGCWAGLDQGGFLPEMPTAMYVFPMVWMFLVPLQNCKIKAGNFEQLK